MCTVLSPNEKVDEDNAWEEEAFVARVSAEQEAEVTDNTEQQHPHHVQLQEQEQAVHSDQRGRDMLHRWCDSWVMETQSSKQKRLHSK